MDFVKHFTFLLLAGLLGMQAQEEEGIPWEAGQPLDWSDFRGTPPDSKRVAATTASGITYSYRTEGPSGQYRLVFEVAAYFYPQRSWYHPELCDSMVLSHEQLHFDITEIYARKMRKLLNGRTFGGNVRTEVRKIFNQINRELSEFQHRYDRETDFSRNRGAQKSWNARVGQVLEDRGD